MKYFTQENLLMNTNGSMKPKSMTLDIIRQIAYTYRSNINEAYCLN